jgi:hypothetical protein
VTPGRYATMLLFPDIALWLPKALYGGGQAQ